MSVSSNITVPENPLAVEATVSGITSHHITRENIKESERIASPQIMPRKLKVGASECALFLS